MFILPRCTCATSIFMLTSKILYDKLLALEDLPPSTTETKLLACGVEKNEFDKIYPLPFTKEVKLAMFQCKIIHYILPTNSLLHKMKKAASPFRSFCPTESQSIWHLFTNYTQATSFWANFQQWFSISELDVMFRITRFLTYTYCLDLNHLIC